MHFFSVPSTIQRLFPSCTWRKSISEKIIYLTFDDGPHPNITPWVLETLKTFEAKATFFCVGENIVKFPAICMNLLENGHRLANHTHNHIKGWRTSTQNYLQNIDLCELALQDVIRNFKPLENSASTIHKTRLFRPPYGQIKPSQIKPLLTKGYEIVQWSDLSCDYDPKLNCHQSYTALIKNLQPGNIVVFHDSEKAFNQLKNILPKFLRSAQERGYRFETL